MSKEEEARAREVLRSTLQPGTAAHLRLSGVPGVHPDSAFKVRLDQAIKAMLAFAHSATPELPDGMVPELITGKSRNYEKPATPIPVSGEVERLRSFVETIAARKPVVESYGDQSPLRCRVCGYRGFVTGEERHADDCAHVLSLAALNHTPTSDQGEARARVERLREALEQAVHGAIVRWSNGEQGKPIKSIVTDAVLAALNQSGVTDGP